MTSTRVVMIVLALALTGCGDRAPPALWPEPPPPTLAEPIGDHRGGPAPDAGRHATSAADGAPETATEPDTTRGDSGDDAAERPTAGDAGARAR